MTANQVIDLLFKHGWRLTRISGSHHIFDKPGRRPVVVPVHGNADIRPLDRKILRQAGIVV